MPKRRWIKTNSEHEMFRGDLENASKYRDHVKLFASSFLKPQYARVAADEALGKNDSFAESPPPPTARWRCGSTRAMASFLRFLDHTQRRITVGRTPLDE